MKKGFRFHVMLAILMVAFVCVILVISVNYYDSRRMLEQNYVQSLDEKLTIQAARFDETMQQMYQTVKQISHAQELREQIQTCLQNDRTYSDRVEMSQLLHTLLTFDDYDSVLYLYLPSSRQMYGSEQYDAVYTIEEGTAPGWEDSTGEPFTPLFLANRATPSSKRVFAYPQTIYDGNGTVLGIICLTIDERRLYYELLDQMQSAHGEAYRILAPDGTICSAKDVAELGTRTEALKTPQINRMNADLGENNDLFVSVEAPFSSYRVQCQSDLSRLTIALRLRAMTLGFISLITFLILSGVAKKMSDRLMRPIEELTQAMDQAGAGDFTTRVQDTTDGEFEVLRGHFNNMIAQIDNLMEQNVHERTQKKQAELNALQYQIRPHFMYNTLNSIRFAATLQKNQKLAELLAAFIALLEASVQRQGAFIPLRAEIKLVRDYLSLQAFRYMDCFEAVYEIAPEAETCYVPCLLLQPMIENAVFHGVDPKRKDNRIVVCAWVEGDALLIEVQDNGRGIQVKEDAAEDKRRLTGIGLQNVKQRLQLYYGDQAQFTIASVPEQGTTVRFSLPVSHDPEEYTL